MAREDDRPPLHHVELAVSFSEPSCLLLSGWVVRTEAFEAIEVLSTVSGWDARPIVRCQWRHRADVEGRHHEAGDAAGFCAVIELEPERLRGPLYLAFHMRDGRRLIGPMLEPAPFREDMRGHLRRVFAVHRGLVAPELMLTIPRRMDLLSCVAAPPAEFSESVAMWVEHTVSLPDGGALVSGWCYAAQGLEALEILDVRGRVVSDVLASGVFFPRLDVAELVRGKPSSGSDLGFAVHIDRAGHEPLQAPLMLSAHSRDGKVYGVDLPPMEADVSDATTERLLGTVAAPPQSEGDLVARCLGPALLSLRPARGSGALSFREHVFGDESGPSDLTVIVAGRPKADWLRYQLAVLADNDDEGPFDLWFLLSDPLLEGRALQTAADVQGYFGMRLRLLVATERVSVAAAVNAAVRRSEHELVLLMDGAVLPRTPGFISGLRAVYRSLPDACGVGPKLIGPDGTVELGLASRYDDGEAELGAWDRSRPDALVGVTKPTPVRALATDCLLTRRALLLAAGGLAERYWQASTADLDLSDRLQRDGRRLYFAPELAADRLASRPVVSAVDVIQRRLGLCDRWLLDRRRAELEAR